MANEVLNRRNNELVNNVNDPFFDNLARRFFSPVSDWMDWATPAITSTAVNGLLTDVKETKDAYEVHVDVPGIDKNNIKMNYHDGVLSINAHKDDITDHADKNGNIKAAYQDGVLNITMPKLTESKESGHNIEIQ